MRSSCKTLYSGSDKMQCWAWENQKSSSSFVVVLGKDPVTGAPTKQKGATARYTGSDHYDQAVAATQKNYDDAIALGWRAQKRGYAGRQSPTGRTAAGSGSSAYNAGPAQQGRYSSSGVGGSNTRTAPNPPRYQSPSSPFSTPYNTPATPPVTPPLGGVSEFSDVDSAARAIVKEGFRILAVKHHPDRGGTHATMAVLTETRHQLMQMLDLIKD